MPEARQSRISTQEHGRRVRAWHASNTCDDAAKALDMTYDAFAQWRRNMGLPTCADRHQTSGLPRRTAERIVARAEKMAREMAWLTDDVARLQTDLERDAA